MEQIAECILKVNWKIVKAMELELAKWKMDGLLVNAVGCVYLHDVLFPDHSQRFNGLGVVQAKFTASTFLASGCNPFASFLKPKKYSTVYGSQLQWPL